MATLYIAEYTGLGDMNPNSPTRRLSSEIAQTPAAVEQTVAIGVSSVASSAFGTSTYLVRLHCDAICSIEFGSAAGSTPTATAAKARMAANQTEYFAVVPGQIVAVITNS